MHEAKPYPKAQQLGRVSVAAVGAKGHKMTARIVVTLVCEYDGDDVDDYGEAMDDAAAQVQFAGDVLAEEYEAVRVVEVTVTG